MSGLGAATERVAAEELQRCGCVAPREEAAELARAARGDPEALAGLVARRCTGEPLAWLTGSTVFCGARVRVCKGVYVPRVQTEPLVREALARLPERGLAVDLCTGCGAVAVVLARGRPDARVLATEVDPVAVACARANGVDVYAGDLAAPLPAAVRGHVDLVTAVVPYVPTDELRLLPRDVLQFEPRRALDGGADGGELLRRAAVEAAGLLRRGGSLLLELGGDEAELLRPFLTRAGYTDARLLRDDEGDPRGLACRLAA